MIKKNLIVCQYRFGVTIIRWAQMFLPHAVSCDYWFLLLGAYWQFCVWQSCLFLLFTISGNPIIL